MHRSEKDCGQNKTKHRKGRPSRIFSEAQQPNSRNNDESRSRSRDRSKGQNSNLQLTPLEDNSALHDQYGQESLLYKNSNQDFANLLRVTFIDFFSTVRHSKGLVFTPQQRLKLIKQEGKKLKRDPNYKKTDWNKQSQWEEDIQMRKIGKIFQTNQTRLSLQQEQILKDVFLKVSYIFADEFTQQLYRLLLTIANASLNSTVDEQLRQMKTIMNDVCSGRGVYKFFSFQFSSYFKLSMESSQKKKIYEVLGGDLMAIFRERL